MENKNGHLQNNLHRRRARRHRKHPFLRGEKDVEGVRQLLPAPRDGAVRIHNHDTPRLHRGVRGVRHQRHPQG